MVGGYHSHTTRKIDRCIVMQNFAALCATVFPLLIRAGYPTTSWPNCALWGSRRTSGCSPIQSGLENAQERSEDRSKSIEKWYTEHTSIQGIIMLWIWDAQSITFVSFPASLVHTRGIVHGPGNRKVLHYSTVLSDIFSLSVLCVASAGSWKWPSSEISLEEALEPVLTL